ncbi:MAG: anti-sigma factor [Solirubrobacteraceae bacterium]|nr:anti-sigma factor [Solirubrobacteraceae bacterium]
MIDDRDLLRHLESGDASLWDRPEPPELDVHALTGGAPHRHRARRTWSVRPVAALGGAVACLALGVLGGATLLAPTTSDAPTLATTPASTPGTAAQEALPARRRQVSLTRFGTAVPAEAAAQASVFTATDGRTVDLRVKGLTVPRKGEFYELWALGAGTRMISLGIVRVDASGSAQVRLPLPVSLRRFPVFDVSLEPGDGNPKHSGQSVLRSEAAA